PRPLAAFRGTLRPLLAARRLHDVERGALRVHHHLKAADAGYFDHLSMRLASEPRDLRDRLFEIGRTDVHRPERWRFYFGWLGHHTANADITAAIENCVGATRVFEWCRLPDHDPLVEGFSRVHIGRHQLVPHRPSKQS